MLQHSSSEGRVKFTSMFETHLAYKFNCSEIIKYYKEKESDIAKLAIEFAKNGRSTKFEKYIGNIPNFIEDYKRQRLNGFFETKNALKEVGVKNIPIDNEYLHYILLRDMVKGILNIELERTVENNIKLEELNCTHYLGIARTIKVLKKGYDNHTINFNKEKFSNNFVDEMLCYEVGKNNDTVLITDDGKTKEGIITTFKEKGYPEKTMELDKYLQFIGYTLPPSAVHG